MGTKSPRDASELGVNECEKWVELGYISGLSGVRGWLKLFSYTRPRENISHYRQFATSQSEFSPKNDQPLIFTDIKSSGKHIIGKIKSVDSRDEAELLLGKRLWVAREELKKNADEYFWHELIGLKVFNLQSEYVGVVEELMETGANDVLVVKSDTKTTLIPYVVDYYVLSVDVTKKTMKVDWEADWLDDKIENETK